jgi:hypothetical protein
MKPETNGSSKLPTLFKRALERVGLGLFIFLVICLSFDRNF